MSLCLSNRDRHTFEYKLNVLYSLMFSILFSIVSVKKEQIMKYALSIRFKNVCARLF